MKPGFIIPERDDAIAFPECDEESWRQYFVEFREKVWPMFKSHGFTQGEAWFAWQMQNVITRLDRIADLIEDDHGDCPS